MRYYKCHLWQIFFFFFFCSNCKYNYLTRPVLPDWAGFHPNGLLLIGLDRRIEPLGGQTKFGLLLKNVKLPNQLLFFFKIVFKWLWWQSGLNISYTIKSLRYDAARHQTLLWYTWHWQLLDLNSFVKYVLQFCLKIKHKTKVSALLLLIVIIILFLLSDYHTVCISEYIFFIVSMNESKCQLITLLTDNFVHFFCTTICLFLLWTLQMMHVFSED